MTIHSGSPEKVLLIEKDDNKIKKYKETILNFLYTGVDVVKTPAEAIKKLTQENTYSTVIIDGQIFTVPQGISIIKDMLNV
jgi:DNA-binding NtrC family response regulator